MVNPYCESINGYLAEFAYYGIIKDEDAQCFKANVAVEPTFYILLTGAVILAVINTFVMKAVAHYFHDKEGARTVHSFGEKTAGLNDIGEIEMTESEEDKAKRQEVHPVPVMFTDRFRWLLYREDVMVLRQSSSQSPSQQFSIDEAEKQDSSFQPVDNESLDNGNESENFVGSEPWPEDESLQKCLSAPDESGAESEYTEPDLRNCFSSPDQFVADFPAEEVVDEQELPQCFSAPEQSKSMEERDTILSKRSWPLTANQSSC